MKDGNLKLCGQRSPMIRDNDKETVPLYISKGDNLDELLLAGVRSYIAHYYGWPP